MKFKEDRPLADPEAAMARLLEIANGIEADHAGRIAIGAINHAFLSAGGTVPSVWFPGEAKVMVCTMSGVTATLKVFATGLAEAKVPLPAWLALIVQLPAVSNVRVVPLAVQTVGVADTNETARPEEACATSAAGAVPKVWLPGEMKVMVCAINGAAATLKVCVTIVAPAKVPLAG